MVDTGVVVEYLIHLLMNKQTISAMLNNVNNLSNVEQGL